MTTTVPLCKRRTLTARCWRFLTPLRAGNILASKLEAARSEASVVRFMGLDVGKARIGVAVSDETGLIARGVTTLQRTSGKKDFEVLTRLVEENEVHHVVVGNPLNMDGTAGKQSLHMRSFAERLRSVAPVEVSLWDERLSSFAAEQLLIERGTHWSKRKQEIDKLAAVVILQDFLDHHKSSPTTEEMKAAEDHGQD